jgi:hypothetical protein
VKILVRIRIKVKKWIVIFGEFFCLEFTNPGSWMLEPGLKHSKRRVKTCYVVT